MKEIKYDTKKLRLAQVRYFEKDKNAVEILRTPAYVFLWEGSDNRYYNVFDITTDYPVYKRVPYSNVTKDGEEYGSKIMLASGKVKDGVCYVLENTSVSSLFEKDEVTYDELADCVMKSDLFFVDRVSLFKDRIRLDNVKYIKKIIDDLEKMSELNSIFQSHGDNVIYRKR